MNIQKKPYFYKLINVYPYLFPECCREQHLNCYKDELDQINQTVHSEKEFFMNKSKKPCVHTLSNACDYDTKFDSKKDSSTAKEQNNQTTKNVEFKFNDQVNVYPNSDLITKQNNINLENISPTTTSASTTTTTTTANQPNSHKISLKPIPNKSVGQSLISSFVQLDGTYFRHMKLKRDSISYRR